MVAGMSRVELDPGRSARLELAVYDAFDAKGTPEFDARLRGIIELDERLRAEQLAELGYLPSTTTGCIAVLNVAAAIVETMLGQSP